MTEGKTAATAGLIVEVDHRASFGFALEQAGVPLVTALRVRNVSDARVEGIQIAFSLQPDLGDGAAVTVPALGPGEDHDLGPQDLRLPPAHLRALREAERATLVWTVRIGDVEVERHQGAVDLTAANEWPGEQAPPGLLASFVMPNHPVVTVVLRRVRDRLGERGVGRAFDAYQSGSPDRVRVVVEALYDTLGGFGVTYAIAPASFEKIGQKVRAPDVVLHDGLGNCLDVTCLFASCLEAMGLHPLLVTIDGHAFPGVWLVDDRFPEGVVFDAPRLKNAVALDQVLFWDSSAAVSDPSVSFASAVVVALRHLELPEQFRWALDVHVARLDRYRPLPMRDLIEAPPDASSASSEPARADLLEEARREPPVVESTEPPPPPPLVDQRFRRWKDRLLDLSLRNKLLAFQPKHRTALPIDVPDLARFEDRLMRGTAFELHPAPTRDPRDARDEKLVEARADADAVRARHLQDLDLGVLHLPIEATETYLRAVHLARTARSDFEEGGANTLFAAIGFLRWYESADSKVERLAPLWLVPVKLEASAAKRRLRLVRLPDDPIANETLAEKMRRDFSIDLSRVCSPPVDDDGVDVPGLIRGAREAIQAMPRWEVLEVAAIGQFSFGKFLLWKDLDENAQILLQNPIVQHIATKGAVPHPNPVPATRVDALDDDVPVADIPMVLDADSTQLAAVVSALRGRSFVLQGPPGTGKSQTISNLIAAALAQGKTVLFVAEKMAALDVVLRRLKRTGLGPACLELHNHKANKKDVVSALSEALDARDAPPATDWSGASTRLQAERDDLNRYVRALHAPRPSGFTAHMGAARLNALRHVAPVGLTLGDPTAITADAHRTLLESAQRLAVAAARVDPVSRHVWRRATRRDWSAVDEQRLRASLDALSHLTSSVTAEGAALAAAVGVTTSERWDVLSELATALVAAHEGPVALLDDAALRTLQAEAATWADAEDTRRAHREALSQRWSESLFALDLDALTHRFQAWTGAFFLLAWIMLWSARRALRPVAASGLPANPTIRGDLELAQAWTSATEAHRQQRVRLASQLRDAWTDGEPTTVREAVARLGRFRGAVDAHGVEPADREAWSRWAGSRDRGATDPRPLVERLAEVDTSVRDVCALAGVARWPSRVALSAIRAEVDTWRAALTQFRPWCAFMEAAHGLRQTGAGGVVDAFAAGELRAGAIADATERAFLDRWVAATWDSEPSLKSFDGAERDRRILKFRADDAAHVTRAASEIAHRLAQRRPRASTAVSDASEPGIIRREARKKARHLPVRQLLAQIPNLLPRLKPCLLMSPMSVAQYLPAGGRLFDLVVFDEASQICTHDAIGALARGRQVIVVGDSRQLPPTAFFQRGLNEEASTDENDFDELESILEEAIASNLDQEWLGWHYRSRHEALIQFSNERYYDGRLWVFPAARGRGGDLGVAWIPVPGGVYDKSRTRTNRAEAETLVRHLVDRLRRTAPGARSFGVVTFSMAQRVLVDDLLDEARRQFPEIDTHFTAGDEPVIVKNLENVQGDERDEILFSIGYGPDDQGHVWMNFGPLNRDGGERRLNVAVTRARMRLAVFSTLTADQIDLSRTQAKGARHLKEFLRYAELHGGARARHEGPTGGSFDSDFERDVFDAISALGWQVDCQVGAGGYRIDLAVHDPGAAGEYLLGVECDGAAYHSAATARDRDRLRQQVLEGLGWRLHRVWSTDWRFDRQGELDRLERALQDAQARVRADAQVAALQASAPPPVAPADGPLSVAVVVPTDGPEDDLDADALGRDAELWTPLAPTAVSPDPEHMHSARFRSSAEALVRAVLDAEAPIHIDELARRLGAAFGGASASARVRTRALGIAQALRPQAATVVGEFLWWTTPPERWDRVRGAAADGSTRAADRVPPEEFAVAAGWVLSEQFSLPRVDLVKRTARLLGYARAGSRVTAQVELGVDMLIASGRARVDGERVVWGAHG